MSTFSAIPHEEHSPFVAFVTYLVWSPSSRAERMSTATKRDFTIAPILYVNFQTPCRSQQTSFKTLLFFLPSTSFSNGSCSHICTGETGGTWVLLVLKAKRRSWKISGLSSHLPAGILWESYVTYPSLSSLICKMGTPLPISQTVIMNRWANGYVGKVLNTLYSLTRVLLLSLKIMLMMWLEAVSCYLIIAFTNWELTTGRPRRHCGFGSRPPQ